MSRAASVATLRSEPDARSSLIDRGLEWAVLSVLVITVLIYVIAPFLALTWWRQPFLGAFVEQTLIFNGIGDPADPAWSARGQIPENDQLLAVAGVPVATSQDLAAVLSQYRVGDQVPVTTQSRQGETHLSSVTLSDFPLTDRVRFFFVPYLVGVIYLAVGGWVFRLRGREAVGRSFALTCALTAIATGGLFDLYTTHVFTWAWTLAVPNAGAAAAALALVFPQPIAAVARRPLMRLISFIPSLLVALVALSTLYGPGGDPRAYVDAWRLGYYYLGAMLALLIGMMLYRWRTDASPLVSAQSRIVFFGTAVAFAPLIIWVVQALVLGLTPPFNVLLYLGPILLFPAAVAYAILRYRLLDTDVMVGQALSYALLGALSVAAYSLIIAGVSLLAGAAIRADDPLAVGLLVFLLVLSFNPLRARTQRLINSTFFRGSRSYTLRLEQFGRTLTQAPGLAEITHALREALVEVLRPAHAHVFLRENASAEYAAAGDAAGRPTSELRFAVDGPLASYLAQARAVLLLSPDQPLPERLVRDRARLAVQGSALFVPLAGKSGLTGWLAVGPKLSGEPFRPDDLRFVESLADQAALAIERAAVINDLERRVKELNVVSQMSQAVSFTRAFDDLLELIHGQTSKIVDARNFYLLLKDRRGGAQSAFVVENDERLTEREGKPAPVTQGLEAEVLRTGQPIRVDDYTEECHRRGVVPGAKLYRAWLGMPLNAGRETLGIMIVAATDPTVVYTDDQAKVCATIADQAASALTRARLLQQAEQRARQLSTLNEVSLTIASTLELDLLLLRIVQSAANILNCEAGSLFLIDPETGESVFRVATGPVGQNLVGMRVAPGKGFVGEAIENGRAVIVNDAQNDPRWFRGTDQTTGFITQALITVPLRYQSRPIGAIQLINKRDGSPFDDEDQTLLTAFATPSAIAIENARLFTQTDQALAARVEELSVMQRIGRELNTTLDTALVAGITLSWAMKSTGATAGWVGLAGEAGLTVIECEGYGAGEARLLAGPLPLAQGLTGRVFRNGEPVRVTGTAADLGDAYLAETTRSALAAPIRREAQVVGLVVLESIHPEAFPEESAAFLTRLLDLTSIALTNSRLYAEVNAANIAKSEFVSFVAHELKTPMTSIKGYADLLVGGAVGSVNDMQKQFLGTIRANVERMNTLVSDLSDVARIESGRLRLEPKPVDFSAIIDEVTRSTKALVDAKQQTLTVEAAALPPVRADYVRLGQVLTNLVSNAYKYTPEGGQIWLRAAAAPNTWDPAGAPEVLHVSVQDTGIGISAEDQKKLFQKFFRAEDRLAREMAPGTGLGLNIVKNLVELQGGRIWMESEFRKGSVFHFTIPLAAGG